MSKSWTPEEVRNWILKTLYDIYMDSPTARVSWGIEKIPEATDQHPSGRDIYRECEWLKWKGLLDADFGVTSVFARITPAGREYVEQNLLKASSGSK